MPASRIRTGIRLRSHRAPRDCPVAFGADLSPASVLSAYRNGIIPFPASDEYVRNINEFRYEDQVDDGVIGLVGSTHRRSLLGGLVVARPQASN